MDNLNEKSRHVSEGTVLYWQNEDVHAITVVLRGKVLIQNESIHSVVCAGCFLGVYDLFKGCYQADYIALEDITVIDIEAESVSDIAELCRNNTGYGGLLVSYFSQRINSLYSIYEQLTQEITTLDMCITQLNREYLACCEDNYISPKIIAVIDSFCDEQQLQPVLCDEVKYYNVVSKLGQDIQKAYFGSNSVIYMHHLEEQYMIIDNLYHECEAAVNALKLRVGALAGDRINLFGCITETALELAKHGGDITEKIAILDSIKEMIKDIEELYDSCISMPTGIDVDKIDRLYMSVAEDGAEKEGLEARLEQLTDSLDKIIVYSGISNEEGNTFREYIERFDALPDKYNSSKELSHIREVISKFFYKIYYEVFVKAVADRNMPLYIRLFLKYGYVSEKLLTDEQLADIVQLDDNNDEGEPCRVYTLYQWLKLIIKGEKEPSKSEFDLDYDEFIRSRIKEKRITENEAAVLRNDVKSKLKYEIDNLFRSVNRLLSIKITAFVPILYGEECVQRLCQSQMSAYRINNAVKKIQDIDYSLFSREVMYTNPKAGIARDYVIKEVYPDIILFPCYGSNGVMWQDISGKKRDSKGRIIFPILFEGDEYVTTVAIMGRYRWELCKTIQGVKWNDIRIKSLTSEYQDYIQFFRKNSALTEEWKEKIGRQIKNCRNNTREIFARDYSEWILRESTGGMRLSKVSREIMATYCPFVKEIRERQEQSAIYANAMKRFNVNTAKKRKEYEAKCIHISRAGKEVPEEILITKEFYNK